MRNPVNTSSAWQGAGQSVGKYKLLQYKPNFFVLCPDAKVPCPFPRGMAIPTCTQHHLCAALRVVCPQLPLLVSSPGFEN